MKQSITKFILMAFMLLVSVTASAYVEIDGIFYNLSGGYATVTYDTYGHSSYAGDIVIPPSVTYNGREYIVNEIHSFAFEQSTELTSVVIPNTVRSIGEYAFQGCTNLTSFNIPEQVTVINDWCFGDCNSLDSVVIPEGITEIGACAFHGCANLTSITFPESITKIGGLAFDETPWFDNLPDGLVYIGKIAYKYHGRIPNNCEIDIREGTVCISSSCFWEWSTTGLTSITIPNSVRSIGFGAFYNCGRLTSIDLPEGLEEIESSAFAHCSSLTSVVIPASVTSFGARAFDWCDALESLSVAPGNTIYDSRDNCNAIIRTSDNVLLEGCKTTVIPEGIKAIGRSALSDIDLLEVTLPSSLKTIYDYAFQLCSKLTHLELPDSLTSIGEYAFRWCSGLTTVSIGSSVQWIGNEAFAENRNMTDVYCYATRIPNANTKAFKNSKVNENTVLHVPYELLEQYRNTAPWSEFKEIVPLALPKCEAPTITLLPNGKVSVQSATEGATCVTNITACNEEPITDSVISLSKSLVLYTVTSYATAEGYEDSDAVTATFRWEGTDSDITGDGITDVDDVIRLINMILTQ